jgi:hypothetical protein
MVYLYRKKGTPLFLCHRSLETPVAQRWGGKEDYSSTPISIFIISQAE